MPSAAAANDTWEEIREQLRRSVPESSYDHWLRVLEAREVSPRRVVLAAPDRTARWVADRFGRVLHTSAAAILGTAVEVEVVPDSQVVDPPCAPPSAAPAEDALRLNPDYTFGNFVIGQGNRLAHAAALAVAELPGGAYNPLFLCGPPGVGKTHLLHSVADYVHRFGDASVICVTADSFTSSFVQALQTGGIARFKAACRGADVLLLDDVQFLQDKTRTEEELFHTFNALYEMGRQLVFTSDRPPLDISALEERLRERFAAGLVAEIAPPDFETRLTILRKLAGRVGARDISPDLLELLASRVTGNVRALSGTLAHLIAVASLHREELGPELAERLLPGDATSPRSPATVRDVQDVTCQAFSITHAELISSSRAARLAWPRQLAMHLARRHTDASLQAIGREFGGRDHATVLYACRRVATRLEREPAVRNAARAIEVALDQDTRDRGD